MLEAKKAGEMQWKIQSYTPKTMTIDSDKKDFLISEGIWKGRTLIHFTRKRTLHITGTISCSIMLLN